MGKPVFRRNAPTPEKGVSVAFPDVCKTPSPGGPVPVPYPQISLVRESRERVKIAKQAIVPRGTPVAGVEPGTSKQLLSPRSGKVALLRPYSMDVKVEGKAVVRHMDLTMHNHAASPRGNAPPAQVSPLAAPDDDGAAAAAAVLEQVDEVLAEYDAALRRAPSFTPRQAARIQREFEARLEALLSELKSVAGENGSHQEEIARLERAVAQATSGRRRP